MAASYFAIMRQGGKRLEETQYPTKAEAVAEAKHQAAVTGRQHLVFKLVGTAVPQATPAAYEDAT